MVTIADTNGNPKGDSFFDILKKNQDTQGAKVAARSTKGFLYFNESNPGSTFTTQNVFGYIAPSSLSTII